MSAPVSYSTLDRMLHHVAFAGIEVQKVLADLEDRLFAERFEHVAVQKPVFITSLPRAGTTLLLEVLTELPDFAAHTYRDMPFVLAPILWNLISKTFRKEAALNMRAHGDGIAIGFDSPEAFEEILWKAFWPGKYSSDHIHLWSRNERNDEFESFFRKHIRKIVALHSTFNDKRGVRRYISKNNANIARLELLVELFPDCRIIIPIRNPWDHIGSLRNQHERFIATHAEDRFSRRYMEWLGHFEFGATLRPIDFGGWMEKGAGLDTHHEKFWLHYWAEAYEAILEIDKSNLCFFDYDRACSEPATMLEALANAVGIEDQAPLLAQAPRFRPQRTYARPSHSIDTKLVSRVEQVYEKLKARSVEQGK